MIGNALPGLYAQSALGPPGAHPDLLDIVLGSSPIVQGVLLLLVFFSIGSLAVILYKYRQVRSARAQTERFLEIFWEAKNLAAINAASVDLKQSPVAHVFRAGYQELMRLTRTKRPGSAGEASETTELGGIENVERAMRRATNQEVTRLERALTFLATTASTAPFVGLFGTVWGVMNAFRGLTAAQNSSIQAVAPGIAEALIATAVGLAAAIPAVVAFNHFARHIRVLTADMDNFSAEFLNIAERHFIK
ncbi:MAG: biopolymer transport protein TolQ [Candidatus Binatota bacterium]|nr:biopolymer transport protein TolQ [Candidatus Binatota bacterium]